MADGDTLRSGLKPIYRTLGRQVREGYLSTDELIRKASECIKKTVQKYKDEPIRFLKQIATQLQQINAPLFANSIDLAEELSQLRSSASEYDCHKDAMNLAVLAGQQVLNQLQAGEYVVDIELALYKGYMELLHKRQFDEPLRNPLVEQPSNLEQVEIEFCLDEIRQGLEESITKFAEQLKQNNSVDKLRMPPSPKPKGEFDLDVDLHGSIL